MRTYINHKYYFLPLCKFKDRIISEKQAYQNFIYKITAYNS